jgi:hypothetical protein
MALPILPDETWESEAMPKAEVEDESAAHRISDTQWTTSIWSAADTSTREKTPSIQVLRNQHHVAVTRVQVTDEDSRKICRKVDNRILLILVWAYFLQVLPRDWCRI